MKNHYSRRGGHRGFSLVELLVTIAVLGIIAGMAMAALTGVNGTARVTAAKRQAQQISSVFTAGEGVGAPGFKAVTDVASAMDAVGTGSAGAGSSSSMFFKVPGVSSTMDDGKPVEEQAKHYLSFSGGSMIFQKDGVPDQPPAEAPGWHQVSGITASYSQALNWVTHFTTYASSPQVGSTTRISGPNGAWFVEQYW